MSYCTIAAHPLPREGVKKPQPKSTTRSLTSPSPGKTTNGRTTTAPVRFLNGLTRPTRTRTSVSPPRDIAFVPQLLFNWKTKRRVGYIAIVIVRWKPLPIFWHGSAWAQKCKTPDAIGNAQDPARSRRLWHVEWSSRGVQGCIRIVSSFSSRKGRSTGKTAPEAGIGRAC